MPRRNQSHARPKHSEVREPGIVRDSARADAGTVVAAVVVPEPSFSTHSRSATGYPQIRGDRLMARELSRHDMNVDLQARPIGSRARARSPMRSRGSSRPIDSRTVVDPMWASASCVGDMWLWVIDAG